MRFTYDAEVDILMIHLAEGDGRTGRFSHSERLPGGSAVLDWGTDGTLLSIEIMGAARRYGGEALAALPMEGTAPISLAEAARLAGVGIEALKQAAQRGRLEARKIGRNWTTTPRELDAYLESRKHGGPGSAAQARA